MVDDNARFSAAVQEIVVRIQTRETVLLSYMGLSGTLLSIGVANQTYQNILLSIPYLALAASLLSAHHDIIIGLLHKFVTELTISAPFPNWHKEEDGFIKNALRARTIRDVGALFFVYFTVILSLIITFNNVNAQQTVSYQGGLWWGGAFCVFLVSIVYWGVWRFRNEKWPFE